MKALFVGDVHNHTYMFEDIIRFDEEYKFDRIIFVGDYVDDWNTTNHESLQTLERVIQLKNSNPNKYTFCIGNHELSYLGYPCSGHNYELDDIVMQKLRENIDCFDFYTTIKLNNKDYYCSHAGFSNDYIDFVLGGKDNYILKLERMNSQKLNYLFELKYCSYTRGGDSEFGSFVWTDKKEHIRNVFIEDYYLPYQIMGHTPVKEIDMDNNLLFIDTHSTYRDGSEYGDKSYLMWNRDRFEILY